MKGISKDSDIKVHKQNKRSTSTGFINQQTQSKIKEKATYALLTNRESEIMNLISTGKPNKEIAQHLDISVHTVKNHNKKIFNKLGVKNRSEAIVRFNMY